jgi:hypothetical protein
MSNLILQTHGTIDTYLTDSPQIDVFKYKVYRYTNFVRKVKKVTMSGFADFNSNISVDIPKSGHILTKMYIHLKLPKLTKIDADYLNWSDNLSSAIIDGPITLSIGGVIVDRMYPDFEDLYDELSSLEDKRRGQMTLKSDMYQSAVYNASKETDIYIPLRFSFTKNYKLGLPIASMIQDIKINFKMKSFFDCINYNGTVPPKYNVLASTFFTEYIDLDPLVIDQFANYKHTFVIDQVQEQIELISNSMTNNNFNSILKFNSPCKELIFALVEKSNIDSNNYYAYSRSSDDLSFITDLTVLLNGISYIDDFPESYYRLVMPYQHHSRIPLKYVYSIPFAIYPEDTQPSGKIDLSKISEVVVQLKLKNDNPDLVLRIYAITYNIATIENGIYSLLYNF